MLQWKLRIRSNAVSPERLLLLTSGFRGKLEALAVGVLFGGLAALAPQANGQGGVPLWTNYYNGPGNYDDEAEAITVDSSGNAFVTGYSAASLNGPFSYATIKYSG